LIRIASPLTGSPCFVKSVTTNSLTGEYTLRVPPLAYKLDDAYVISNAFIIDKSKLTNTSQIIDVTNAFNVVKVQDSLRDVNGGFVRLDSTKYNLRRDFIYRNTPIVNVTMPNGFKLYGEDTLSVGTNKLLIKPIVGNTGSYGWGPFNWPIFKENKKYSAKITASEIYTNTDNLAKDTVKLTGTVLVTNDLVNGIDPNSSFLLKTVLLLTLSSVVRQTLLLMLIPI